ARTLSPGRPPATKRVLPSTRATPRPSWERSVMSTSTIWVMESGAPANGRAPWDPVGVGGNGCPVAAAERLLALPGTRAVLIIPAGTRLLDPLPGERVADLAFPLRMAVGDGDFAVDGLAVTVLVGDGGGQRRALGQRHRGGIAHRDLPVVCEPDRPALAVLLQHGVETLFHARLDRLHLRSADADVGLLRMRARNQEVEQHRARRIARRRRRGRFRLRARRVLAEHPVDELRRRLLRG